jgi:Tol biopolymer transport system component
MDPFITPDGQRLYFSSIRAADGSPSGDLDVWVVERTKDGWSAPARVGPEVNSAGDELYPSVSRDGTLYVASGPMRPRPGEHFDIYRAQRRGSGFAPRERLGDAINTQPVAGGGIVDAWEFNPEISPDGRVLVFTSLRPGGHGLGDLYVSRFEGGAWTPARNLGPRVNTAADEYHPTLSRDGRSLYFVRRGPRPGDFHRIATRGLPGF